MPVFEIQIKSPKMLQTILIYANVNSGILEQRQLEIYSDLK